MSSQTFNKWQVPNLGQTRPKQEQGDIQAQKKEGFEQGYQQGLAKAQAEMGQTAVALNALVQAFQTLPEKLDSTLLELMKTYCQQVIEQVIFIQLKEDENVLIGLLEKGMNQLKTQQAITIELHPDIANEHLGAIKSSLEERGIKITENPNCQLHEIVIKNQEEVLKSDLKQVIQQALGNQTDDQ